MHWLEELLALHAVSMVLSSLALGLLGGLLVKIRYVKHERLRDLRSGLNEPVLVPKSVEEFSETMIGYGDLLEPKFKGSRDVFFVTDRAPAGDNAFSAVQNEEETLHYGRAWVTFPHSHKRGEIERPWKAWGIHFAENSEKHIVIARRTSLAEEIFYQDVNGEIDDSPEKSAFVFVHGFNVSFDDALLRAGQLAFDLHYQGPAVVYSWPSAGAGSKYVSDLDMADWSAPHLTKFLLELRARTGVRTVHLVAHSMGSKVLGMALERIANGKVESSRFQELVLAAPDIHNSVLEQMAVSMHQTTDRVTLYASDRDHALGASSALRGGTPRAGKNPIDLPGMLGFDIIDATRAHTLSILNHGHFAEDTVLLNDLALLLKERLPPNRRSITLEPLGDLWVFVP